MFKLLVTLIMVVLFYLEFSAGRISRESFYLLVMLVHIGTVLEAIADRLSFLKDLGRVANTLEERKKVLEKYDNDILVGPYDE